MMALILPFLQKIKDNYEEEMKESKESVDQFEAKIRAECADELRRKLKEVGV